MGECWLQSARVARKAGHLQTAFNALLNAENTHLAELVSEKAKWLWSKVTPAPKTTSTPSTTLAEKQRFKSANTLANLTFGVDRATFTRP